MLDVQRAVEIQHRVEAIKPIRLGGERDVVPGRELFDVHPGDPAIGKAAGAGT